MYHFPLCPIDDVFISVPSGAPSWVSVKNVTSLSVTVQWGPVDCKDLNGHLEGYSVRYGVVGSGNTQQVLITDSGAVAVTLPGLYHSSYYSIELAAVNSVGVGVYSPSITVATTPSKYSITDITQLSNTTLMPLQVFH